MIMTMKEICAENFKDNLLKTNDSMEALDDKSRNTNY